jgi:general stress protein YciG
MATQGKKPGGGMTVAEAGRMGGKLVSEKYGPEFYEKIGKKGGSSTAERYGPEFFGRIGRKGGKAVSEKYGAGHFERIGRKGGQKVAALVERAKTLEGGPDEQEKPEPELRPEESIGA